MNYKSKDMIIKIENKNGMSVDFVNKNKLSNNTIKEINTDGFNIDYSERLYIDMNRINEVNETITQIYSDWSEIYNSIILLKRKKIISKVLNS